MHEVLPAGFQAASREDPWQAKEGRIGTWPWQNEQQSDAGSTLGKQENQKIFGKQFFYISKKKQIPKTPARCANDPSTVLIAQLSGCCFCSHSRITTARLRILGAYQPQMSALLRGHRQ